MKFILTLALVFAFSNEVFAVDYMDLNLSENLGSMTFGIYSGCGEQACKGVELTVPTGSKVSVEAESGASCSIQRSAALEFKGGDSYIVDTEMKLNSNQACVVNVVTKEETSASVKLVNLKLAL